MPKEIFGPMQYNDYKKYLAGPIKQIKNIESGRSHTTLAYWIPPNCCNESHVCDNCGGRADFLLYDKDHMSQTSVNLYCKSHANPAFEKWLNEAEI